MKTLKYSTMIFADYSSPLGRRFSILGTTIKYTGENNQWTQSLFNEFIPKNKIYIFEIKITHRQYCNIFIGILDKLTAKYNRTSFTQAGAISYFIGNGDIFPYQIKYDRPTFLGETV